MNSVSNSVKFPCACCAKPVKTNTKGLKCTECNQWLHISCAGIPCQRYDDLSESFENWQCNICLLKQLPFHYVASVVESKSYDKPHSSYTLVVSWSIKNLMEMVSTSLS